MQHLNFPWFPAGTEIHTAFGRVLHIEAVDWGSEVRTYLLSKNYRMTKDLRIYHMIVGLTQVNDTPVFVYSDEIEPYANLIEKLAKLGYPTGLLVYLLQEAPLLPSFKYSGKLALCFRWHEAPYMSFEAWLDLAWRTNSEMYYG
jgi:hypothetical protein